MASMWRKQLKFLTQIPKGRHFLSVWASRLFEKSGIKKLFGLNLVAAIFLTTIVSPQLATLSDQVELESTIYTTPIAGDPITKTTFDMPLVNFRLSQRFSFWHPGLDMTASRGTPVYAIEEGVVEFATSSRWGYGKHILITHPHQVKSLYAHLSSIETVIGQKVARGELVGRVGSTGWSTGNHLHFEIYQNGISINPLEVLPIEKNTLSYDPVYQQTATASPTLLPQNPQ